MGIAISSAPWFAQRQCPALGAYTLVARFRSARAARLQCFAHTLRAACYVLIATLTTAGCSATAKSPPGSGIVVDKDKKPVAGAHVIVWRSYTPASSWWDVGNFVGPKSKPSRCHKEHYALSDAQGRFTFPGEVIDRPGEPFTSYIAVSAIKENTVIKSFTANIEPTSTGLGMKDGHQKDYFPTKEKPLAFTVEMEALYASLNPISWENWSRITVELEELIRAGCTCTPYTRAIWAENLRVDGAYFSSPSRPNGRPSSMPALSKIAPGCSVFNR